MSGRRPLPELTKEFSPERRRRIDEKKRELLAEIPLNELRRALELTQRDLARLLNVNQPTVSKIEHHNDVFISSLPSYIKAAGGKLKIIAEFPGSEVAITNFSDVGAPVSEIWTNGNATQICTLSAGPLLPLRLRYGPTRPFASLYPRSIGRRGIIPIYT